MTPKLYLFAASPPCATVNMVAKRIGLELDEIIFTTIEELQTPEFLKLNPQHSVPLFVDDDGFALSDSHAIITYITAKYGKDKSLYPEDPKLRAIVDQRLHFESGVLFPKLFKVMRLVYSGDKKEITQEDRDTLDEGYGFLEAFLEGRQWLAGNSVTLADYSILPNVASQNGLHKINEEKFPKLLAWLKNCDKLPEIDVFRRSLAAYREMWAFFGLKCDST